MGTAWRIALTIIATTVGWQSRPADSRPDSLVRLDAARMALRTGHIQWSKEDRDRSSPVNNYLTVFTPKERVLIELGDETGTVTRTMGGGQRSADARQIKKHLAAGDRQWVHTQGAAEAEVFIGPRFVSGPDPRTLGVATALSYTEFSEYLWRIAAPDSDSGGYEDVPTADGMRRVVARRSSGKTIYLIDPKRQWNPIRVTTLDSAGKLYSEARIVLKQYGGIWYPETVSTFSPRFKNGKEPRQIIRVSAASFNKPSDPQRLSPRDIGIEPGMKITVHENTLNNVRLMYCDGSNLISQKEYYGRLKNKTLTPDPGLQKTLAERQTKSTVIANWMLSREVQPACNAIDAEWGRFVSDFICEHGLVKEQSIAAMGVKANCLQKARAYLEVRKAEWSALADRLTELTRPHHGKSNAEMRRILDDARKFRAPVDEIFEAELKPRLIALLTLQQKARAPSPATSQPSP